LFFSGERRSKREEGWKERRKEGWKEGRNEKGVERGEERERGKKSLQGEVTTVLG
jgi:hypothetical protein